jgi:2-oxoglutarate dehydrogenase E2 component (dihydrolipoamide succinyltransferase)
MNGAGTAEVLVPPNEEGTRATVLRWYKRVGDIVVKDEPLVELETDKVTVEIPAPQSGTLLEILLGVDAEVSPADVLARVALGPAGPVTTAAGSPAGAAAIAPAPRPAPEPAADRAHVPGPLSPAVRRMLREHTLAATDIAGSGRDGRVTAEDVARHLARPAAAQPQTPAPSAAPHPASDTRRAHSPMRRRIAEHMTRSLATAPHVTTLFEADLSRVLAHRQRRSGDFERQGVRLTLTAYFIAACARALSEHPQVNASFEADALVLHGDCNVGIGTALGAEGLVVPVIHGAQALSLLDIARRLGELTGAARAGKLAPADVRGGTFTLSNHGVSGSLLAAPIVINQPQVAILGIGKVERRVCVLETDGGEAIGIRSLCYLTLTIDHRALDAFQANAFLSRIVELLEGWPAD